MRLERKVPPPLVGAIAGTLMWGAAGHFPTLAFDNPIRALCCGVLIALGLWLDLSGFLRFRRQRTTINPLAPENTSALVTGGVYRWSRNPMYLGQLFLVTAWVFWLSNLIAFIFLPVFVAYLTRFQIMPEERILREKFGADYADYCRSVRRWI